MSIGSETNGGVRAIRVVDLAIDGADNGLRIKSNAGRGGLVEDVEYRDVCIRNTHHPIEMNARYSGQPGQETTGTLMPQYRDIRLVDVRVLDGGDVILDGYDAAHPIQMSWSNVVFDGAAPDRLKAARNANIVHDDDVRPRAPRPVDCAAKFLPREQSHLRRTSFPRRYAAVVDARFTGVRSEEHTSELQSR